MNARFDLTVEPWIPCELAAGGRATLGLHDVLGRAHEIRGIRGDIATQEFALTRLLLAVLHSALRGPATLADWQELWAADTLPAARIVDYLGQHRDRFDLLHPRTPFFQVVDLRTAKQETFDVSRLVADLPTGAPVFAQRRGPVRLGLAEAARWLVHVHAFDVAGIKSGAVGDPRVRGGKTYPIGPGWAGRLGGWLVQGATLRETLLLNLGAADHGPWTREPGLDLPVWERAPHGSAQERTGRAPTGPVDLYTWQSRRVRLVTDLTDAESGPGTGSTAGQGGGRQVVGVLVANGDELAPEDGYGIDPHTVWRANPPRTRQAPVLHTPLVHRENWPAWRALPALLPTDQPATDQPATDQPATDQPATDQPATDQPATGEAATAAGAAAAGDLVRPGVAAWVGHLVESGALADESRVVLRAVGLVYGVQRAVITDIVDDQIVVAAAVLAPGTVAEVVTDGLGSLEAAVNALGGLAGDLVDAAGGDGTGPRDRTRTEVRWDLAPRVRSWMAGLEPDVDPDRALGDVQLAALHEIGPLGRELLNRLPPGAFQAREVGGHILTAAHAESRYHTALRKALPYAVIQPPPTPAAGARAGRPVGPRTRPRRPPGTDHPAPDHQAPERPVPERPASSRPAPARRAPRRRDPQSRRPRDDSRYRSGERDAAASKAHTAASTAWRRQLAAAETGSPQRLQELIVRLGGVAAAAAALGVSTGKVYGRARWDPQWRAALDEATAQLCRDTPIPGCGSVRGHDNGGRCAKCRAAKAADRTGPTAGPP